MLNRMSRPQPAGRAHRGRSGRFFQRTRVAAPATEEVLVASPQGASPVSSGSFRNDYTSFVEEHRIRGGECGPDQHANILTIANLLQVSVLGGLARAARGLARPQLCSGPGGRCNARGRQARLRSLWLAAAAVVRRLTRPRPRLLAGQAASGHHAARPLTVSATPLDRRRSGPTMACAPGGARNQAWPPCRAWSTWCSWPPACRYAWTPTPSGAWRGGPAPACIAAHALRGEGREHLPACH